MIRLDTFSLHFWLRFGIILVLLASLAWSFWFWSKFGHFYRKLGGGLANDAVGCIGCATCIIGGLARLKGGLLNDAVIGLRCATCIIGGLARSKGRLANDAVGGVRCATCIIGGLVAVLSFR